MSPRAVAPLIVHTDESSVDVAEFFAARHALLREGVLILLRGGATFTATQLRRELSAGMRELDRVLQELRKEGKIRSVRRWWELVS